MRLPVLLVSLLTTVCLIGPAAQTQPLMVNKGQWFVTRDSYYAATEEGNALDLPAEHSAISECWTRDEEVLIDESIVGIFPGCAATSVTSTPLGIDVAFDCEFEGVITHGSAKFSVSHGRDSFAAQFYLTSPPGDPADFRADILMMGHRTGVCEAPG